MTTMTTTNVNNDDIRCGLFKEVKVNCNYIRHLYEESKRKEFNIDEKYEELFWYEYNAIVSCRSVNDKRYEEHLLDDLENHINESSKWVTEWNVDSDEEETINCSDCDKKIELNEVNDGKNGWVCDKCVNDE